MFPRHFGSQATFTGLLLGLAFTVSAAPVVQVFPGASNTTPNFDNLADAITAVDAGGTIEVQPGLYEITAPLTIDKPLSIIGPLDGVDTASTGTGTRVGTGLGGYQRDTLSQGEASFAANLANTVITITSSQVTIAGLDFETSASTFGIIRTPPALGLTDLTIRDNVFRRATVAPTGNANSQHAVRIEDSTNVTITGNSVRNLRGGNSGAPDHGVIWLINSSAVTVARNEIRNNLDVDRAAGILIGGTGASNDIVITRNRIWGDPVLNEQISKYAISFGPSGTTNNADVTYNVIEDFSQAGVSTERSNIRIIGNRISSFAPSNIDHNGAIYVRNGLVNSVTIRDNILGPNPFQRTTPVGAAINLQAFATTLVSNGSLFTGNIYFNNRQVNATTGPDRVAFGIQPTTVLGSNCGTSVNVTNSWWGTANGPVSARRGGNTTYGGVITDQLLVDACTGQVLPESTNATTGTGESIGNRGRNSTQPIQFFPWALFRGDFALAGPGSVTVDIPAEAVAPFGNDRYFFHSLTANGLDQEGLVRVWSPANRQGLDNSVEFSVEGTSFTNASVRVHFQPGAENISNANTVRLVRWNSTTNRWSLVPGSTLDLTSNTVSGVVTELGQFGAREGGGAPAADLNGPALVGTDREIPSHRTLDGPLPLTSTDSFLAASSANLTSMTVILEGIQDAGEEVLAADTTGTNITASYNAVTGVLLLSGVDTVDNYQSVLRSLTYENSATNPQDGTRTVSLTVEDSYGVGDSATVTLSSVFLPVGLSEMSLD